MQLSKKYISLKFYYVYDLQDVLCMKPNDRGYGLGRFAGAFAVFENKCTNSFGKIRKKNDIAN